MDAIKKPVFKIEYGQKDITKDIADSLLNVSYSDAEEDESDEITIQLHDADGKWMDEWYPTKGDTLKLSIGYEGEALVACGSFVIDELSGAISRSSGAVLNIKALAAGITNKVRTKRSTAHEKQTLRQIAEKIASANGLTVQGDIPSVQLERVSQYRETDLAFLSRLSKEFGCMFSVRDKKLVFTSIYKLESGKNVRTLDFGDLNSFDFTDKTVGTAKEANAKYANPKTKEIITASTSAGGTSDAGTVVGGDKQQITAADALELRGKAENEQQARLKSQAALHRANSREQTCRFTTYGDPLLIAGNNVELTGLGKLSGRWHISKSTHRIDRTGSGYVTECEAFRLKDVDKPQKRKRRRPKRKAPTYTSSGTGGGGGGYGDRSLITQSD